jgi:hypothetical protein
MSDVNHLNLLDKCKRRYRGERRKNPEMPALVDGAGRVIANGALKVELLCIDGSRPTYVATPVTSWTFKAAPTIRTRSSPTQMEVSPADKARAALNVVLDALAKAEGALR